MHLYTVATPNQPYTALLVLAVDITDAVDIASAHVGEKLQEAAKTPFPRKGADHIMALTRNYTTGVTEVVRVYKNMVD